MGLFSSSRKSTTQNTTNIFNDDKVIVSRYGNADADEGTITDVSGVKDSNVQVIATDQGAVKKGLELANKSLDHADKTLKLGFDFGDKAIGQISDHSKTAFAFAGSLVEALGKSHKDTIAQLDESRDDTLQLIADNSRTETDKLFQQASKFGMVALFAVSAVLGISIWAGRRA